MKTVKWLIAWVAVILFAGCGDAEPQSPPVEAPPAVETNEVVKITPTELQILVGKYEATVVDKLAELEDLKERVKEIPVGEIVDEQTEVLKGAVEDVSASLKKMSDELAGYLEDLMSETEKE